MMLAPIAFFAYRRPEHTLLALEALSRCELAGESRLVVFCDGPKRPEDADAVRQVREVVKSRSWCGTVEVVERERNIGLANSVVTGVSDLCREYGRVIVLEDDLVVSPYFLRYMNEALEKYRDEERVMQISGHMFDAKLCIDEDALFLSFITSWGWGTWQRAWQQFDETLSGYEILKRDPLLRHKFNLDGNYRYFEMLQKQIIGKIDSWAIIWNFSVFMRQGLVLYPVNSLVYNGGFDGSGTHCGNLVFREHHKVTGDRVVRFPTIIGLSPVRDVVHQAIWKENKTSISKKLLKLQKRMSSIILRR